MGIEIRRRDLSGVHGPGATHLLSRRTALLVMSLVVATATRGRIALASEEVAVPLGLQAELLSKVAAYDRNLPDRATDKVRVLLVSKPGNADSVRAMTQLREALGTITTIAGLPHEESVLPFSNAPTLAEYCKSHRIAIVYFGPGFRDDVPAIRAALSGLDILSVSAVAEYVPLGIVLGFDLVSGKPKLLIHLTQAKAQHVALKAEVLKLMRVYE
jgi:hypothetical protein